MHRGIKYAFAFISGAAISAVITGQILKKKYEERTREEVDSFIEYWTNKDKKDKETQNETEESQLQQDMDEYAYLVGEYTEGGSDNMAKPKEIPPEEFGVLDDYEIISLIYYADGVLTDTNNVPVEDVAFHVGADFASYFGHYEDDAVHIQNDRLKCYYEILADEGNYADVEDPTDDK